MKILQPTTEIISQNEGIKGIFEMIEIAGKTCYQSPIKYRYYNKDKTRFLNSDCEDFNKLYNQRDFPIKESITAEIFTQRMIDSEHYAMLEHGTVYLKIPKNTLVENRLGFEECYLSECYQTNSYSKVRYNGDFIYVTTNFRVLIENNWYDDLNYFCDPTEYHEKRITFRFITQIAISREFNRHRVNSVAEQSTRYCNYSKDKFDNSISINKPSWVNSCEVSAHSCEAASTGSSFKYYCDLIADEWADDSMDAIDTWLFGNLACQWSYLRLIRLGWTAQQARVVLPLDLNTELIHTAFVSDWEHFLDLRHFDKTGAAHPDAKVLAASVYNELKKLNLI